MSLLGISMRRIVDKRGQARIFEAVLMLAVVLPLVVFVQSYYAPPSPNDPSLSHVAAVALTSVDRSGVLLDTLSVGDYGTLERQLHGTLPFDVNFHLTIISEGGSRVEVGESFGGESSATMRYIVVAPDGKAFYLTLILWRV